MQRRLAVNVHGQMPWSAGSWAGEWTLDAHVWWPRGSASDACVAMAVGAAAGRGLGRFPVGFAGGAGRLTLASPPLHPSNRERAWARHSGSTWHDGR